MSHADKRTPHTDALETLGTLHGDTQQFRDAIHLAVEPVEAGEDLNVGQRITYSNGKAYAVRNGEEAIGIVDPFLNRMVQRGDKFWLVVLPRMITSLRHVWSHPVFPDEASVEFLKSATATPEDNQVAELMPLTPQEAAYQWIADYAHHLSDGASRHEQISADELIAYGKDFAESNKNGGWGDYLVKGGLLEGTSVSDEFWDNLAVLEGTTIEPEHRGNFFSCSC